MEITRCTDYLKSLTEMIRRQFAKICIKKHVTQSAIIESCIKKFIEQNRDYLDSEDFEIDNKQIDLKPFFKKR